MQTSAGGKPFHLRCDLLFVPFGTHPHSRVKDEYVYMAGDSSLAGYMSLDVNEERVSEYDCKSNHSECVNIWVHYIFSSTSSLCSLWRCWLNRHIVRTFAAPTCPVLSILMHCLSKFLNLLTASSLQFVYDPLHTDSCAMHWPEYAFKIAEFAAISM